MAALLGGLALAGVGSLVADPALSDVSVAPKMEAATLGVVAFERVGASGVELPDVAELLAQRLREKSALRVIGPGALGVPPEAEPPAEEVRRWAREAGVRDLVVGRTTRLGRQLSVDLRLRSGATGAVMGTYVEEVGRGDELSRAIDRLADRIVDELDASDAAPGAGGPPAVGAAPPVAPVAAPPVAAAESSEAAAPNAVTPAEAAAPSDGFLAGGLTGSGGPIDISAAETEFVLDDGRTIFRENVRVTQGDVTLTTDRLEALFDDESQEPERLIAAGNVRIVQRDKTVTCNEAIYEAAAHRVFCRGDAHAVIGEHTARGDEIEFRLDVNRVFVRGTASDPAEIHLRGNAESAEAATQ